MLPRFLAASIDPDAGVAHLSEEEARHLARVLRLGVGDEVAVFDGNGREFRARVEQIGREGAVARLIAGIESVPEPAVRLTLAQSAIKGDRMDDVIRDATMMGVAAIEPLVTEHTAAQLKPGRAPDRWRRIAIASAKQCGRAVVPSIGRGATLPEWLAEDRSSVRLLLLEPSAGGPKRGQPPFPARRDQPPASASLLVGPEGGWSAAEIEAAIAAGYEPITLGRRTLRADAVAIVAIGVLQYGWGDL